jgi:hypothetical protein
VLGSANGDAIGANVAGCGTSPSRSALRIQRADPRRKVVGEHCPGDSYPVSRQRLRHRRWQPACGRRPDMIRLARASAVAGSARLARGRPGRADRRDGDGQRPATQVHAHDQSRPRDSHGHLPPGQLADRAVMTEDPPAATGRILRHQGKLRAASRQLREASRQLREAHGSCAKPARSPRPARPAARPGSRAPPRGCDHLAARRTARRAARQARSRPRT